MSEAQKKHPPTYGHLGHKHSEETRKKIGLALSQKITLSCLECKSSFEVPPSQKDRKYCSIGCNAKAIIGVNHPRWVSDRTKLQRYSNAKDDRRSSAYREWRHKVKIRDGFKCKIANQDCSGRLEVHHILSYTSYPELKYELNNGIALCSAHHPKKRDEENKLIPYFQGLLEPEMARRNFR